MCNVVGECVKSKGDERIERKRVRERERERDNFVVLYQFENYSKSTSYRERNLHTISR